MILQDKINDFEKILEKNQIYSVFQPIVSLCNGDIFGYEALSRVPTNCGIDNIQELFDIAETIGKTWELEKICRVKAIQKTGNKPKGKKLFINLDVNIIDSEKFRMGFTKEKLEEYHVDASDIIFEITERKSISDPAKFQSMLEHYKEQDFQIAIDDFGSGYSGLNRICISRPHFIKIDMHIVRGIHQDVIKKSLVKSMVQFCEDLNIRLIAEGIETKEEMKTLILLGVHYGQGFFLGKPQEEFYSIEPEIIRQILKQSSKSYNIPQGRSYFGSIGTIAKKQKTILPYEKVSGIYDDLRGNETISEIVVADEQGKPCGVVTRRHLLECLSGLYGYTLNCRREIREVMKKDFLSVDEHTPIETVSKLAMAREIASIYDGVIVTQDGKYLGTVTISNLLTTAINIQVKKAVDANPLTGLPGNEAIQIRINEFIRDYSPATIIYIDIDNFKAYNDAYGFNNGDNMIKMLANIIDSICEEEDFRGHIGGDDFVIITDYWGIEKLSEQIFSDFEHQIQSIYSLEDRERGFILSKNRKDIPEIFPLATLSISAISNEKQRFLSIDDLSKAIAKAKKQSKQMQGNALVIV